MSRKSGPSAGIAAVPQRQSYQQSAASYLSPTTKLAEEFSSLLTFLETCENSNSVLHNCTSTPRALSEWGISVTTTKNPSLPVCLFFQELNKRKLLFQYSSFICNLKLRKEGKMILGLTDRRGIQESSVLFTDLPHLRMILGHDLPSVWLFPNLYRWE